MKCKQTLQTEGPMAHIFFCDLGMSADDDEITWFFHWVALHTSED